MNQQTFSQFLIDQGACADAREWAKDLTLQRAYESCSRPDWILWLAQKMIGSKGAPTLQTIILAGIDCAETALQFVPVGEDRPRKAIEAARACVQDPSEANREAARQAASAANAANAAYYAAHAAANAAHAAAANAAAYAAHAANAANAAYYAAHAAHAANAAANAAAKEKANQEMCDIIRKRFDCQF